MINIFVAGSQKKTKFAFYSQLDSEKMRAATAYDSDTVLDTEGTGIYATNGVTYMPFEEFKEETRKKEGYNYSEIATMKQLKPDAIVCYDKIKARDKAIANEYGLDIVLIDTTCYPETVGAEECSKSQNEGCHEFVDISEIMKETRIVENDYSSETMGYKVGGVDNSASIEENFAKNPVAFIKASQIIATEHPDTCGK